MIRHQGIELLEETSVALMENVSCWGRGEFDGLKSPCQAQRLFLCLLPEDENIRLPAALRVPHPPASHLDYGLAL